MAALTHEGRPRIRHRAPERITPPTPVLRNTGHHRLTMLTRLRRVLHLWRVQLALCLFGLACSVVGGVAAAAAAILAWRHDQVLHLTAFSGIAGAGLVMAVLLSDHILTVAAARRPAAALAEAGQ